MVLVSGYDSPLYKRMLDKKHGWKRASIEVTTRGTNGKDLMKTEILWMNEPFVLAQKANEVPIKLSKMERDQNKVNPTRGKRAKRKSAKTPRARRK